MPVVIGNSCKGRIQTVLVISELASITNYDILLILDLVALFALLGTKSVVIGCLQGRDSQHTSPNFLAPVLERMRGVVGRIRLMWLPATVGAASVEGSVSFWPYLV